MNRFFVREVHPPTHHAVIHAESREEAAVQYAMPRGLLQSSKPVALEIAKDPSPTRAMPNFKSVEVSCLVHVREPRADGKDEVWYCGGIALDGAPWTIPASARARAGGYTTPGWYHKDEAELLHGPYESPELAEMALRAYCLFNLDSSPTSEAFHETLELINGHRIVEEGDATAYFEAIAVACLLKSRELRARAGATPGHG